MISGEWVTCTIASGKTSTECNLGRVYEKVMVYLPALAQTGTNTVIVQGGKYKGDAAKDIYTYNPADGKVDKMITENTAGDVMVVFPIGGFQFITFVCGEDQTSETIYCCGVRS